MTLWLSPVAVGTSTITMIMTLVALTGAVSHISLGAQLFPLPMAIVVASCLLGAAVSAKFANRCEIRRLNRIAGVVLILLGAVTILISCYKQSVPALHYGVRALAFCRLAQRLSHT